MNLLKLDDNYEFGLEFLGRKVRLVVYDNGVENVCRKETLKNLKNFIQSRENHIFRGRLQLVKNASGTNVMVKGQSAGILKDEELMGLVNGH